MKVEEKLYPLQKVVPLLSSKVIISPEVKEKIEQTCLLISEVEWSGTLFYKVEKKEDITNFIILDFYMQDIGNKTFTSYKETPDVVTYMAMNDLLEAKRGLIHSHNTFNTFFSSTDISTLRQEGSEHIHFLSLIVNNDGQYSAAITTKIVEEIQLKSQSYFEDFFGNKIELPSKKDKEEIITIQYEDLEIETIGSSLVFDIKERIKEIKEQKEEEGKIARNNISNNPKVGNYNYMGNFYENDYGFEDFGYTEYSRINKAILEEKKEVERVIKNEDTLNFEEGIEMDSAIFNGAILNILQGTIIHSSVEELSRAEVEELINKLPELYKYIDSSQFERFMENLIENIIDHYDDVLLNSIDDSSRFSIIASSLVEDIKDCISKPNSYITKIIELLSNYILEE